MLNICIYFIKDFIKQTETIHVVTFKSRKSVKNTNFNSLLFMKQMQ